MSAAAPPPPPSPPPPPAKSNQPAHYVDMPLDLTPDAKNKSKQPPARRWGKHFKQPESPKVATPIEQRTRRSFIWPWLEGKLEKKSSSFSGEGSSSSHLVFDSAPVLAPLPVGDVRGPQIESIMPGSSKDDMTNFVAVYNASYKKWHYMDIYNYATLFVAPSPVPTPEANLTELESNCSDALRSGFSLEEVSRNKEEENVVHNDKKKEMLPVEENKVEENVAKDKKEKELQVYVRRSKTKPAVKAIQIGEIEVQVPLKMSETVNVNPTVSASSSANVQDGNMNEEPDELPTAVEDGQGSGISEQKKGKKKKNKGRKK